MQNRRAAEPVGYLAAETLIDLFDALDSVTCQPVEEEKVMDEPVRWVTKAEAAEELDVSLSTLDRRIRKGEVEVPRDGRRVYVRMEGEYITDEELLRRAIVRRDELERTVREMERNALALEQRASEMERERDEAREAVSAGRRVYDELEETCREERAAHGRTRRLAVRLGLALAVLLVVCVLLIWRLVT